MSELFLASIEIGNCVAALDGAALGNSTAGPQERLGELGFSGVAWPDQAHVADVSCCIGHKAVHLPQLRVMRVFRDLTISPIPKNCFLSNKIRVYPCRSAGPAQVGVHGCRCVGCRPR